MVTSSTTGIRRVTAGRIWRRRKRTIEEMDFIAFAEPTKWQRTDDQVNLWRSLAAGWPS